MNKFYPVNDLKIGKCSIRTCAMSVTGGVLIFNIHLLYHYHVLVLLYCIVRKNKPFFSYSMVNNAKLLRLNVQRLENCFRHVDKQDLINDK